MRLAVQRRFARHLPSSLEPGLLAGLATLRPAPSVGESSALRAAGSTRPPSGRGLRIGAADDRSEREADRVADQIVQGPGSPVAVEAASAGTVRRQCAACAKDDDSRNTLRLKPSSAVPAAGTGLAPGIVDEVLGSTGRPLDSTVRRDFEARFGRDFSSVRVHTDSRAAASAMALGASAYAHGADLVFASGRYDPASATGRRLLAHELTHVVQQMPSEPGEAASSGVGAPASAATRGFRAPEIVSRSAPAIRRQACAPARSEDVPSGLRLGGFANASPELPGANYALLSRFASARKRAGGGDAIELHGFASHEGDAAFNRKLSCERATGVGDVVQALGVTNRLALVAHGATSALGAAAEDNRAVIAADPGRSADPAPKEAADAPAEAAPHPSCAADASCPADYCLPFASASAAASDRAAHAEEVLAGLPVSRTVPLFREFIFGGGAPRDISADFAADFTNSEITIATTRRLGEQLEKSIRAHPPVFPPGVRHVTLAIDKVLGEGELARIMSRMAFSNPIEAPGLLAGGIGLNQAACPAGARPSSQDDARLASGSVLVTQGSDGGLAIAPPDIVFTVKDTLDFCPGFCGSGRLAFNLTVPLSRWEASGISGDVPFTVRFAAPRGSAGSEE